MSKYSTDDVMAAVLTLKDAMEGFAMSVDRRFDAVDRRFETVDRRFETVDPTFRSDARPNDPPLRSDG